MRRAGFARGMRTSAGESGLVAAEAVVEKARNAANRCYADAGQIVDLAIRHVFFEQGDDLPAIDQGLQFRWRAQVFEEAANLVDVAQRADCLEQCIFCPFAVPGGVVSIGFHGVCNDDDARLARRRACINVLT